MRIAVTGATGFTGRYFCEAAVAAGHEIARVSSNLNDREGLARELTASNPDAVVHLAAISFVGHDDPEAFYKVNVIGTTNLLSATQLLKSNSAKVLIASSANVYGNTPASPISETQAPCPVNHYATSKLAMEFMAQTFAENMRITLVRPFNYTGPGQALNFVIPKIVDHFRRRETAIELGNIYVQREFNDVRMVCDAYLALLDEKTAGQIFNVCSGQTYTLQDVVQTLTELTGHHLEIRVNPAFVRPNEVHRLCGDPSKLQGFLNQSRRSCRQPQLRDTLHWMLSTPA